MSDLYSIVSAINVLAGTGLDDPIGREGVTLRGYLHAAADHIAERLGDARIHRDIPMTVTVGILAVAGMDTFAIEQFGKHIHDMAASNFTYGGMSSQSLLTVVASANANACDWDEDE